MAELNAFQNALAQFDKAVAHLNLERGIVELLRHPKRELTRVVAEAEKRRIDNRTAAQVLAIQRVAEVTLIRGIYP